MKLEITNENKKEVFELLESKGQLSLVKHIKNTLIVNEENYGIGTEYSVANGYGAVVLIMDDVLEYVQAKMKYGFDCFEIKEEIKEENDVPSSHYLLYLTGNDSAVAIYITDMN